MSVNVLSGLSHFLVFNDINKDLNLLEVIKFKQVLKYKNYFNSYIVFRRTIE